MEIKDISVEQTTAKNTDYLVLQDPDTGITYKITKANLLSDSSTDNSAFSIKLTGTPFGATPSYAPNSDYPKVFDGDLTTFYDYAYPNGGYVGLDLGSENTKKLTKIRVYPRQDSGVQVRSGGAIIQGSNDPTTGYTNLFTFPATPDINTWYEGIVSVPLAYRYLRYLGANGSYSSVAEIEFYGN